MGDNFKKTPFTILSEVCVRQKRVAPFFELLSEGTPQKREFVMRVKAFDTSATGVGTSKKLAKHNAAAAILEDLKLQGLPGLESLSIPEEMEGVTNDSVGALLDICCQREYPIAQFELIEAKGQSHNPDFTYRCSVASIVKTGTGKTKQLAKQKAAINVLNIIQQLTTDAANMQIVPIDKATKDSETKNHEIYQSYWDYKQSGMKRELGVRLSDRHLYFRNLDDEFKNEIKNILLEQNETPREKIGLIAKALNCECRFTKLNELLTFFELCLPNYDFCVAASELDIDYQVVNNLKQMIGVK